MALKIKGTDDRVRATTTALLLLVRDRLSQGQTDDVLRAALADFRRDRDGYKINRAGWAEVSVVGPLTNPGHVAYYHKLRAAAERLIQQWAQARRQFNSLTELDNSLISALARVK